MKKLILLFISLFFITSSCEDIFSHVMIHSVTINSHDTYDNFDSSDPPEYYIRLVHDNINQWETSTESGLLPVTLNGYFGPFMIWDDDFDKTYCFDIHDYNYNTTEGYIGSVCWTPSSVSGSPEQYVVSNNDNEIELELSWQ